MNLKFRVANKNNRPIVGYKEIKIYSQEDPEFNETGIEERSKLEFVKAF